MKTIAIALSFLLAGWTASAQIVKPCCVKSEEDEFTLSESPPHQTMPEMPKVRIIVRSSGYLLNNHDLLNKIMEECWKIDRIRFYDCTNRELRAEGQSVFIHPF